MVFSVSTFNLASTQGRKLAKPACCCNKIHDLIPPSIFLLTLTFVHGVVMKFLFPASQNLLKMQHLFIDHKGNNNLRKISLSLTGKDMLTFYIGQKGLTHEWFG